MNELRQSLFKPCVFGYTTADYFIAADRFFEFSEERGNPAGDVYAIRFRDSRRTTGPELRFLE